MSGTRLAQIKEANLNDDEILNDLKSIQKLFDLNRGEGHTDQHRLLHLEATIARILELLQKGLDE